MSDFEDWLPPWTVRQTASFPITGYRDWEEPVSIGPGPGWYEDEFTVYGSGISGFEPLPPGGGFTPADWYDQAMRPAWQLRRDWGVDNLDIMEQLIRAGYDYIYIDEDGVERSGLWRDWRDAYAEAYG